MWNYVTPQLPVSDVAETQEYYRDMLDFKIAFTRGESFGGVTYGRAEIFFMKVDEPRPGSWCCVRVDDADLLYAIYRERGVKIIEKLADRSWGMREFTIEDPNGHFFRIGHSTR
jgi:catechol 2,3-dioxygenase-like lactoylglutathione lyase family enzyme